MSLMMLMSSEKLGLRAGSLQQRRMRAVTVGSTVDGMSSCKPPQPTAPTTCTRVTGVAMPDIQSSRQEALQKQRLTVTSKGHHKQCQATEAETSD